MKRVLSVLLMLVMLLAAIPAMAQLTDEPVTLTIAALRHNSVSSASFDEKAINWIEIISGEESEKMAVLLAGDHPDAYMSVLTDAMIVENPDLFLPLNDKLEEYCPNVMKLFEQVDGWKKFLTYPDGNIYGMPAFIWQDINEAVSSLPWINKAWLDKLGVEVPKTLTELYDVLVLFRDNDMDGDGDMQYHEVRVPLGYYRILQH